MTEENMRKILEIGISLSAEKDFNRLLELILSSSMELTCCDAGTLYLKNGDLLDFKIMRNHTLGTYTGGDGSSANLPSVPIGRENVCALSLLEERTIRVEDVRNCENYDFSGPIRYDAMTGYRTKSMLVIPMKSREGTPVGVLQLINALDGEKNVCAFADEMVMAVESLASQAAILITNMRYVEDIHALFRSFVRVVSSAIDQRTPYNASHTRHMAEYCTRFVEYLNQKDRKAGRRGYFTHKVSEELLMSIWLHDIGKLLIPLEIMDKGTRLNQSQRLEIHSRLEALELRCRISRLEGEISRVEERELREALENAMELIAKMDTADVLSDEMLEQLNELRGRFYTREDGTEEPWLTEEEFHSLEIRQGTLSEKERRVMESHVTITEKLLSQIEFSEDYCHVLEWASKHHEYLDGSGYPKGLTETDIPYEVRILTILDIFDALVADDRPYKPGYPVEKAVRILQNMAERGKLDRQLTRQFADSRCWEPEI